MAHAVVAGGGRRGFYRRVSVQGSEGIAATVIVKTIQGNVWISIIPPFTWEAIMDSGQVDELIHTLGMAREDAAARSSRMPPLAMQAQRR
jgi:hypothetical protein